MYTLMDWNVVVPLKPLLHFVAFWDLIWPVLRLAGRVKSSTVPSCEAQSLRGTKTLWRAWEAAACLLCTALQLPRACDRGSTCVCESVGNSMCVRPPSFAQCPPSAPALSLPPGSKTRLEGSWGGGRFVLWRHGEAGGQRDDEMKGARWGGSTKVAISSPTHHPHPTPLCVTCCVCVWERAKQVGFPSADFEPAQEDAALSRWRYVINLSSQTYHTSPHTRW